MFFALFLLKNFFIFLTSLNFFIYKNGAPFKCAGVLTEKHYSFLITTYSYSFVADTIMQAYHLQSVSALYAAPTAI